jgi:hypothetical protein
MMYSIITDNCFRGLLVALFNIIHIGLQFSENTLLFYRSVNQRNFRTADLAGLLYIVQSLL